jgi:hypothetical protein
MRPDQSLDAVLIVHRANGAVRSAVLAAGFDPMAECDTVTDGLVLTSLYRPDLVVVEAAAAGRAHDDIPALRAAAGGVEVIVTVPGTDSSDLARQVEAARLRILERARRSERPAARGLPSCS